MTATSVESGIQLGLLSKTTVGISANDNHNSRHLSKYSSWGPRRARPFIHHDLLHMTTLKYTWFLQTCLFVLPVWICFFQFVRDHKLRHTVDGWNPKQPPGMVQKKTYKQWDFNYQPQLVSGNRIEPPSTVGDFNKWLCTKRSRSNRQACGVIASIHKGTFFGGSLSYGSWRPTRPTSRSWPTPVFVAEMYGIHEFVMDRLDSIRTSPTLRFVGPRLFMGLLKEIYTLPETNMAPENGWLEY